MAMPTVDNLCKLFSSEKLDQEDFQGITAYPFMDRKPPTTLHPTANQFSESETGLRNSSTPTENNRWDGFHFVKRKKAEVQATYSFKVSKLESNLEAVHQEYHQELKSITISLCISQKRADASLLLYDALCQGKIASIRNHMEYLAAALIWTSRTTTDRGHALGLTEVSLAIQGKPSKIWQCFSSIQKKLQEEAAKSNTPFRALNFPQPSSIARRMGTRMGVPHKITECTCLLIDKYASEALPSPNPHLSGAAVLWTMVDDCMPVNDNFEFRSIQSFAKSRRSKRSNTEKESKEVRKSSRRSRQRLGWHCPGFFRCEEAWLEKSVEKKKQMQLHTYFQGRELNISCPCPNSYC